MRLKKNDTAPHFEMRNLEGGKFDLSAPRTKPLMLSFFRYASCPLCNLRVNKLRQEYSQLGKYLDIVAVFQSPDNKIKQYVGKQNVPFTILPDPERSLYKLYGVESSWLGLSKACSVKMPTVFSAVFKHHFIPGSIEGEIHRVPADFILDTDNSVMCSYYGTDISDHLPLNDIYSLMKINET